MDSILRNEAMDRLPMAELTATLEVFLEPMLMHWPEKRLREVGKLAVQGILSGQSPLRIDCVAGMLTGHPGNCGGLAGSRASPAPLHGLDLLRYTGTEAAESGWHVPPSARQPQVSYILQLTLVHLTTMQDRCRCVTRVYTFGSVTQALLGPRWLGRWRRRNNRPIRQTLPTSGQCGLP